MTEFQYAIGDDGIAIEVGAERFILLFDRAILHYNEACQYAQNHFGHLPSVEQALIIQEFLPEINLALKEAGQKTLSGWVWTNREYAIAHSDVIVVNTSAKGILWSTKFYTNLACVVLDL